MRTVPEMRLSHRPVCWHPWQPRESKRLAKPHLFALILVALAGSLLIPARVADAHMYNNDHIGYYPGISDRIFGWYDETGLAEWTPVEYQHAVNYSINYAGYWRNNGVLLPYLDYHTSGGQPGCFNNYYSVCGSPYESQGRAAVTVAVG